jgi:AcrR family transcriptional regulator
MSGSKRKHPGASEGAKAKSSAKPAIVPMYARLPKGPHRLGATGVARNQRLRMHGGMIEAVTTRGYRQTSVRHVIGLAGVSRRAFYEQFGGKDECFVATFDLVAKRAIQRITHACHAAEDTPTARICAALEAFGEEIAHHPKALRLVLIDSQTVGPRGVARLHRAMTLCEGQLAHVLCDREDPSAVPLTVVRAIAGGLRQATCAHLLAGQAVELPELVRELERWTLLFSSPAAAQLRLQPCANPPPLAPARIDPDACGGRTARARLLRSVIELRAQAERVDELNSLRIADGAHLPIEAFMEVFSSPQECYQEALDVMGDELLQRVADPSLVSAEWPAAVCRTIARVLAYLAARPVQLRTLAVTALEVGPQTIKSVEGLLYEVATLLVEGAPRRPRTGIAVDAITGALWQVLNRETLAGRGHRLPALSEYVAYVVLTPYLGPEAAVAAIVSSRAAGAEEIPVLAGATPLHGGTARTNGSAAATNGHAAATNGRAAHNGTVVAPHDAVAANGARAARRRPEATAAGPSAARRGA